MTDNAGTVTRSTLVDRYAERMQDHEHASSPVSITRVRRPASGIRTFGRTPLSRKRAGSTRSRRAITTLMATAILASSTPAMTNAHSSSSSYEIQPGDTLSQIAASHGISEDELIRLNNLEDPNWIFAGGQLVVSPEEQSVAPVEDVQVGDTVYEIRPGDTLMAIAIDNNVSLDDLLAINEIENPDRIAVGDFLIIPTSGTASFETVEQPLSPEPAVEPVVESTEPAVEPVEPAVAPAEEKVIGKDFIEVDRPITGLHLVARGETSSSIAVRYGITVEQLLDANDLSSSDTISFGDMLRIPDPSWTSSPVSGPIEAPQQTSGVMLENMPVQQQSLPLSTEAAALSMVTDYWGHQVSEWVFIENMPHHPNPHHGFRGDMSGELGGTSDYGAYASPLSTLVSNYGFVGDEFYTMGDPAELKARIDQGQPVLVWMTDQATPQEGFSVWYQGERFTLVPQQTVVVAYGYDEDNIHVADPRSGQHATYSWSAFTSSWSQFDGMSMAVYPAG
jgi:LysM repeat protein/uncharacterized protein YvpB